MRFLITSLTITAWLSLGVVFGATLYTVTDLGSAVLPGNVDGGPTGVLPGGTWTSAYGGNSAGDYVGYGDIANGDFRGFVWNAFSGFTMLGTLGGADSWGMAINVEGAVAGHSTIASGYVHAFEEENGQMFDLGTLGGQSSYAYGINDSGAVVGYSVMGDGSSHAFVVNGGGSMTDLNSLIASNSGWLLTAAYGIDDQGRITGTGVYNGALQEFELDPVVSAGASFNAASIGPTVPEPGTLVVVGGALMLIGWAKRRKR